MQNSNGFARGARNKKSGSFNRSSRNFNRSNSSNSSKRSFSGNNSGDNSSGNSSNRGSGNSFGNSRNRYSNSGNRTGGFRGHSNFRRNRRFGGRGRNSRRNKMQAENIKREMYIKDVDFTKPTEQEKRYEGRAYKEFGLHPALQKNLDFKKFFHTTEIQEKAIPMILEGKNIFGISQTGSGKTGAFLVPMVQKLLTAEEKGGFEKLLVVAPTRELALQILKEAKSLIYGTRLQVAGVIGGESIYRQIQQLQRGGDIVVGTPGRIKDLIERGELLSFDYNNLVVDEVDRMFDMGFIMDMKEIVGSLAENPHTLFFSATNNDRVSKIVNELITDYEFIELAKNKPSDRVKQDVVDFKDKSEKLEILEGILRQEEVKKAIVFVETKRYADVVDSFLYKNRVRVGVIHGDKSQYSRKKIIDKFKFSKINVLVATNVAARGIDIDDITHVINLDEPQTYDEYIHRIGRTGRNGAYGTAFTFVEKRY